MSEWWIKILWYLPDTILSVPILWMLWMLLRVAHSHYRTKYYCEALEDMRKIQEKVRKDWGIK